MNVLLVSLLLSVALFANFTQAFNFTQDSTGEYGQTGSCYNHLLIIKGLTNRMSKE